MNKRYKIVLIIVLSLLIISIITILIIKIFSNKKEDSKVPNNLLGTWISNYSYLYIDGKLVDESNSLPGEYIEISNGKIKFCYEKMICNEYLYKTNNKKITLTNNDSDDMLNDYSYELKDDKLVLTVIDNNMKVITNYVKAEG